MRVYVNDILERQARLPRKELASRVQVYVCMCYVCMCAQQTPAMYICVYIPFTALVAGKYAYKKKRPKKKDWNANVHKTQPTPCRVCV
jgi:hypothetical protein